MPDIGYNIGTPIFFLHPFTVPFDGNYLRRPSTIVNEKGVCAMGGGSG